MNEPTPQTNVTPMDRAARRRATKEQTKTTPQAPTPKPPIAATYPPVELQERLRKQIALAISSSDMFRERLLDSYALSGKMPDEKDLNMIELEIPIIKLKVRPATEEERRQIAQQVEAEQKRLANSRG